MTLQDLTDELLPHFPTSMQKDLKTAVRMLAQALTYADAKSCPLEACLQPLPGLYRILETSLSSKHKSAHTIRNTKNNVSRLFRLAEQLELYSLLPAIPTQRFSLTDRKRRTGAQYCRTDGSGFRRHHWPPELEANFRAFYKWATDDFVPGRDAKLKKRPITLYGYQRVFEAYFGYLHHVLQISPVQFSHLFDFTLIERFVDWHINEKWHRPTAVTHLLVQYLLAMTAQYHVDPTLRTALQSLRKRMPQIRPVYDKTEAWIPLREIEQIGVALWPSKPPTKATFRYGASPHGGRRLASRAVASLMLRLWVHIPYRQRNMREMKLGTNLYRTPDGQWRIKFAGDELKVAMKRGQPNVLDLPFPPTLIETLEAYLATWRPLLAYIHNAPEIFLTQFGTRYLANQLNHSLQERIYRLSGKHWHPHIMRTVWATEWISSGGDFMTAAIMLNDTLETVIKKYSHLRDANVAENAYLWVQNRVNHHHPRS